MYFPKNLITTDLYTNGDEFTDIDGNPYTGYYFSTTFEQYYQGRNPNDDTFSKNINERVLVPKDTNFKGLSSTPYRVNKSVNVKDYKKYLFANNTPSQKYGIGQDNGIFDPNRHFDFLGGGRANASFYSGDQPASPIYAPLTIETFPTEQDYVKGFFTRYFCFKINEDLFYEINKETYDDIITKSIGWSEGLYVAFKMLWYIKGDEGKIKTLNQELIKLSEQRTQRMGLDAFLKKEYLKHFRILPGINLFNSVGLRNYPDRESINMRLPKAYQLGNNPAQLINPNVPAKQNCASCIFNKSKFCNKWKAEIRNNYWCAAYKGEYGEGKVLGEVRDVSSNIPPSSISPTYTPPSSTPPTSPSSRGGGGY